MKIFGLRPALASGGSAGLTSGGQQGELKILRKNVFPKRKPQKFSAAGCYRSRRQNVLSMLSLRFMAYVRKKHINLSRNPGNAPDHGVVGRVELAVRFGCGENEMSVDGLLCSPLQLDGRARWEWKLACP